MGNDLNSDGQGDSNGEGQGNDSGDTLTMDQKADLFFKRNTGSAPKSEPAQESDPMLSATDDQGNDQTIVIDSEDKRKFVFKNIKVDGKEQDLEIDAEKLLPYASQAGTFDRRMSEYDLKKRELEANKDFLLAENERELLPHLKQLNEFREKNPGEYARFIAEFHERNSEGKGSADDGIDFDELDKVVTENPQVPVVGMLVKTLKAFDQREKQLREEIGSLKQNNETISKSQKDREEKEKNAALYAEANKVGLYLKEKGVPDEVVQAKSKKVLEFYLNQKDTKFSLQDVASFIFDSDIQKAATSGENEEPDSKADDNEDEESDNPKFLKGGKGGGAPDPEVNKSKEQRLKEKTAAFFSPNHKF